jgi:hypothetical protein
MRRLADGEHGGDQVVQRPGQVVLGDQDNLVFDAKMVDRTPRNRAVGRGGAARARAMSSSHGPASPDAAVLTIRPHGAVRADSGHDPHQLSLFPSAAFRQVNGDGGSLSACPAGYALC